MGNPQEEEVLPTYRRVVPIAPGTRAKARPLRYMPVDQQRSLTERYPWWVKGVSLITFTWAFLGWLNDAWL